MSLDSEPDFDKKKINKFQGICSTIRKNLKKTRTDTQIKENPYRYPNEIL